VAGEAVLGMSVDRFEGAYGLYEEVPATDGDEVRGGPSKLLR
jgi:hypothetical protein